MTCSLTLKKKAAASLAALTAGAAALWLWRRFGPATYARFDTMFGPARIYEVAGNDGSPVRLLEVGGIVQSGTYTDERYTDLVFEYLKRYDLMFEEGHPIRSVLVLGCGGYDYPEHLVANHPEVRIDAVEIDPAITALAQRYFFLDRVIAEYETEDSGRLNLINDDALNYLLSTEQHYDAIVNDTFDAGTPPAHLATREFAQAVKDRLEPGGVFLTNIVSALDGPRSGFLREQERILLEVFGNARIVPCATEDFAQEDNVVVICRKIEAE